MMTVKELDKALLEEVKSLSYWLFAENDGWVGENIDTILRELKDESSLSRIVRRSDIPHAFPISEHIFTDAL